jgi:hypothetical protein
MNKITRILVLISISVLMGGCALNPETTTEVESTLSTPQQNYTITPEIRTPTETLIPVTPSSMPGIKLPETDLIVFTIPNPEAFSGREGEPRPNWLGWGAETFTVALDGSFWIADTAVYPNRLLRYSPQGDLLQEISLENQVVYAFDLAVTQDSIWVLDISAEKPRVVQLSMDGKFLSTVDISKEIMTQDGEFVSNGAFSLSLGEEGELLLDGVNGYYEVADASGEIIAQPLDALTYYGHTYQVGIYDQATGRLPIFVDGAPFETSPDFFVEAEPFLGFNPDGSFAIAGHVQENESQVDHQVKYYNGSGKLLGTARQRPQTFYQDWNHYLAFGPDGAVYQLLSNLDHSVQIVRLGFTANLPPKIAIPLATPTPITPLQPSESPATDEERARNALLAFFANLSTGNYAEAAAHFSGEISEYARAQMPGETVDAYWKYICGLSWCLPVAEITDTKQVSAYQYIFYTVFIQPGGTRFEIGACCGGDPAATPPVWQFAYPVQKIDGVWKVMRAPLVTP